MARIISGDAGSLPLKVPQGPTRPTSDRVKEALFSALENRVDLTGGGVLDLYAGSGALGLEAISRGATSLIAVESHRGACQVIRHNADTVAAAVAREVPIRVVNSTVSTFLGSNPDLRGIDIVFIDPPYDVPDQTLSSVLLDLARVIEPDTLVVVERRTGQSSLEWPPGWEVLSTKTYGDTQVLTATLSR